MSEFSVPEEDTQQGAKLVEEADMQRVNRIVAEQDNYFRTQPKSGDTVSEAWDGMSEITKSLLTLDEISRQDAKTKYFNFRDVTVGVDGQNRKIEVHAKDAQSGEHVKETIESMFSKSYGYEVKVVTN